MPSSSTTSAREGRGLFLFNNDGDAVEETPEELAALEAERAANKKLADDMADEERRRRMEEEKDREDEVAIVRQINVEYSITAEEEERERRVHEYEIAKVQDEMMRRRSQVAAIEASEEERKRRISEADNVQIQDLRERAFSQELAVQAMEKERVRRLSLPEHRERAPTAGLERFYSCKSVDAENNDAVVDEGELVDGLSEIPVVHGSASKVLVDENSEWRCFIASENAQEEKNQLHALRLSLEEELKAERHVKYVELVGDVRLLRFLRGHKMNVSVAATKYREMLVLRQKLKLDDIRDDIVNNKKVPDEFPHFQKIIPHLPFLDSYDIFSAPDGHVFYFEMTGYADFQKLVTDVTEEEWQTFFLYSMEYRALKLDQLSRQHETLVQTILVRDLTGFSIARFNPSCSSACDHSCRLPPNATQNRCTRRLFCMHRGSSTRCGVLSSHASGNPTAQGAHGRQFTREAAGVSGWAGQATETTGGRSTTHAIPQTGFLGRNTFLLLCEDGATQADIKAGGTLQLPFRMSANDTLCWEYVVKERDIVFAVKFRTQGIGGAEENDKVAPERVSNGASIASSFTASEDGTVVLSWDNSFSWTRGKTIAYKAKVVKSTHDFSSLDISGNDCV
ncbi:CRAL/TRIO, N-terminal domain [Phytophthora cactorum]|nr:CRAL/TRIO, N-terminal domain [Phytophthora cactorum]